MAGIAAWINGYFDLDDSQKIDKKDRRLLPIKKWIDDEYENGRTSNIRNDELKELTLKYVPNILGNEDTKAI